MSLNSQDPYDKNYIYFLQLSKYISAIFNNKYQYFYIGY